MPKQLTDAEFRRLTPDQRKTLIVTTKEGEKIGVVKYIKRESKKLPPCVDKDGAYINHFREMMKFFMGFGIDGINSYITTIQEAAREGITAHTYVDEPVKQDGTAATRRDD